MDIMRQPSAAAQAADAPPTAAHVPSPRTRSGGSRPPLPLAALFWGAAGAALARLEPLGAMLFVGARGTVLPHLICPAQPLQMMNTAECNYSKAASPSGAAACTAWRRRAAAACPGPGGPHAVVIAKQRPERRYHCLQIL